ncbi:hypothetical protein [Burkholderia gladioli]|uniref:hypothetical protein n=1 Tax=Burkholderia gladioli TaxID=28095 RepID=UPI0016420EDF|nr:hypothetical protein [Burkholderia gladioli]
MNKKELARMAEVEQQLREARALRFTDTAAPDLPKPTGSGEETSGWSFNSYSKSISQAWSNSVAHGTGYSSSAAQRASRQSASQRGIPLYSTRLLALRAMRNDIERRVARELSDIDAMIDAELAKSSP